MMDYAESARDAGPNPATGCGSMVVPNTQQHETEMRGAEACSARRRHGAVSAAHSSSREGQIQPNKPTPHVGPQPQDCAARTTLFTFDTINFQIESSFQGVATLAKFWRDSDVQINERTRSHNKLFKSERQVEKREVRETKA